MIYSTDTEYASRNLIHLITEEEKRFENKKELLSELKDRYRSQRWDFETSDINDDFSPAYVMGVFSRMSLTGQEVNELTRELDNIKVSLIAHEVAVQAMSGALLQIAKQGISLVHGQLVNAPAGRQIGSQCLKDVIWQGRNQALHYEEGNPHLKVKTLFSSLEQTHGQLFSLTIYNEQSRARQIIGLLGWVTYEAYLQDMRLLGL